MGRAPCCDKANVKKGPWSPDEDAKLKEYIQKNGTGGNWIALPQKAGLKRCGKSCRLRWLNYLRPNIKHGEFSEDEDRIICAFFASIGSRWSIIAAQLPGRTDNDIKNYWNTKLKKKILMGSMTTSHQSSSTNQVLHQKRSLLLPHQPSSNTYPLISSHSYLPENPLISSQYASSGGEKIISSYNYNSSSSIPVESFSRIYDHQPTLADDSSNYNSLQAQNDHQYTNSNKHGNNLLLIGNNEAATSSSDGSCVTNQIGYDLSNLDQQNYFSNGVADGNQEFFYIIDGYNSSSTVLNGATTCNFSDHDQINPLDYDIEEIKQLINSGNGNCSSNFNFSLADMIKTEEDVVQG